MEKGATAQSGERDKKVEPRKEGSGVFNEIMRYESEKRLGCVTQESDYIKTWVINSGRKLTRVLCMDVSLLRGI